MKFDGSTVWDISIDVGDGVDRLIGGELESDVGDEVGERVEL